MGINTPIPHSLKSEAKKAAKIIRDFSMPSAKSGPDRIIPAGILVNAEGLAILTIVKIGFLVTARGGSGIVIAKLNDQSWSAPSAIAIAGLGGGFEIGAEVTDFVIILNTKSAVEAFSKGGNLTLGGNFTIAAGPYGRNAEGDVSIRSPAAMFTYSKTKGLFAGISIEGSYLVERKDANNKFYHQEIRANEILSGLVDPPTECEALYKILSEHKDMYERMLMAAAKRAAVRGAHAAVERSGGSSFMSRMSASVRGRKSRSDKLDETSRARSNSSSDIAASDPYSSDYPLSWNNIRSAHESDGEDDKYGGGVSNRSNGGDTDRKTGRIEGRLSNKTKATDSRQTSSRGAEGGSNFVSYVGGGIPKSQSAGAGFSRSRDPRAVIRVDDMAPLAARDKICAVQSSPWDVMPTCQAIWPFHAQLACDLNFDVGDVIEIHTRTETQNDWWEGTVKGRTGIFPANYVRLI